MAELRWILLFLGAVALVAVYLYTRRTKSSTFFPVKEERQEPSLEQGDPESDEGIPESPTNLPDVDSESMIVTVRLMARDGAMFQAEKLVLLFRELGLRHGQFGIFHRMPDSGDERAQFSVANLLEPGSFDLTRLKTDSYRGVSLFMVLPARDGDGVAVFDDMLQTARTLAQRMDGELLDELGSRLSVQRERYMREEVIDFERQRSLAAEDRG